MFVVIGKYIEKYFPLSGFNGSTRRYGPLRGPTSSSSGGLKTLSEAFFALWAKKKELIMLFWPYFGNFWCPVVTVVTFSSNLIIVTLKEITKNRKYKKKF